MIESGSSRNQQPSEADNTCNRWLSGYQNWLLKAQALINGGFIFHSHPIMCRCCPGRARTSTDGFKGRCPAIRRPGNVPTDVAITVQRYPTYFTNQIDSQNHPSGTVMKPSHKRRAYLRESSLWCFPLFLNSSSSDKVQ